MNGEAFVATSSIDAVAIIQGGFLQMFGNMETKQVDNTVSISLTEYPSIKTYVINDRNSAEGHYQVQNSKCSYETGHASVGVLNITTFDTERYIISGTFEFTALLNKQDSEGDCQYTVRITNGRFDIKYIP